MYCKQSDTCGLDLAKLSKFYISGTLYDIFSELGL